MSVIKVRNNSFIKNNINCMPRKRPVLEQFKEINNGRKNMDTDITGSQNQHFHL